MRCQLAQRLLAEHHQNGQKDKHDDIQRRKHLHAGGQHQHRANDHSEIENDARQRIVGEEYLFDVLLTDAVYDVDDHHANDGNSAQRSGNHQQLCGVGAGIQHMEPRNQMLIAKEAAEHKAEDRGEYANAAQNSAQPQTLDLIKKYAQGNEHQSLTHIAVHDAEQDGIGNCHQEGRVKFVIGRQTVHLRKGLEQPRPEVVFQLYGRGFSPGSGGVL